MTHREDYEYGKFEGQIATQRSRVRVVNTVNNEAVDSSNPLPVTNFATLVPTSYDEIVLTYVTSGNGIGEIETATYKLSSVTVATLTLSYDSQNRLSGVVSSI